MIAEEKKCSSCCWVWDAIGRPLQCTLGREVTLCEGPRWLTEEEVELYESESGSNRSSRGKTQEDI